MAKYHVGKDGQARPCKAASPDSCPLAKADGSGVVKHFDSLDAAQSYGERVAMGLANESPAQEARLPGLRRNGHYVDDSGHVYPRAGKEWSDDDRAAYVAWAVRKALERGGYAPDPVIDDLKSIAAGEWDWDDIQREYRPLTGYGQSKGVDRWWDTIDSKYPVITFDGGIREAKDFELSLANEPPAHGPLVAGMRDDGHYVDDRGHVYPKAGQEWSDYDRVAYVSKAARDAVETGDYDPDDRTIDDLYEVARGRLDWSDMWLRHYSRYENSVLKAPGFMSDEEWDALGCGYPVITDDGVICKTKDSDRPTPEDKIADKISEYVRSANADVLQNNVSMVPSFDGMEDSPRFDAATAEEKALIRESLDRADAAVASGDFGVAADEYEIAAKHLGYDSRYLSFRSSDPVLERLQDRWDMAYAASGVDFLMMDDLPNDPSYDEERYLEPGTFRITEDGVIPFDLGDDDEDGIRR